MERNDPGILELLNENKITEKKICYFRKKIIKWYSNNGRNFSWRSSKTTKYQKLIAEIFLQKTRAENIVHVYQDFIEKFPNFDELFKADRKSIEKLIKPLGLSKNRSKNLLEIARQIKENHAGKIPSSQQELLNLPGIGIYIANAYLISQHDSKLAVFDTNFSRLYSRFFGINLKGDPRRNPILLEFAYRMLPETQTKKYTFGVIDFAALVCKQKNPACVDCNLNSDCFYYRNKKIN